MSYMDLKFMENPLFLITGGAGFIGSNLCETLLNMGYRVRCLDDLSTGQFSNIEPFLSDKKFEFLEGSIAEIDTCIEACQNVNYVSHQAAWGSVPRSIKMPLKYEEVNIKGTVNMMEAARQTEVKKFVYASSSSVYGNHPALPKVEGVEGRVLSPYALTKKVDEEYGELYSSLYGLETVGLRYFNVFGRRQNPDGAYAAVIPKFVKCLLNNEAPTFNGDGSHSRDFTYIENVIEANLKAMISAKEVSGVALNIAYGDQITLLELYENICRLLNKEIAPIIGPERPGDVKHSNADITKAKEMIKYNPNYDFQTGLNLAINWYKNNLDGKLSYDI